MGHVQSHNCFDATDPLKPMTRRAAFFFCSESGSILPNHTEHELSAHASVSISTFLSSSRSAKEMLQVQKKADYAAHNDAGTKKMHNAA